MVLTARHLGQWPLLDLLGAGSNGEVWRTSLDEKYAAIKVLKRRDRVSRFRDEVEGMKRLHDVRGVLPILDANIPATPTKSDPAWFVMALASPLRQSLGNEPALQVVVSAICQAAAVLSQIHARGCSHRDIKPENLFIYGGQCALGDFGLVAFDGKPHETAEGEKLGPLHYIAPEMLNDALRADGRPADVFSLAKTLWVLATGQKYPLPGAYAATSASCRLSSYIAASRTAALDLLIERCSAIEASSRPSMSDVASELQAWLAQPIAKQIGPLRLMLGSEWQEIASAAEEEQIRRRRHAETHQRKKDTVRALEEKLIALYEELRDTLLAAHFVDVSGPRGSTSPPGIEAWLPAKTDPRRRVGLEVRAWFVADWGNPDNSVIKADLIVRLKIAADGSATTERIYDRHSNFLIGGAGQESAIQCFFQDVHEQLSAWVEVARKHREVLG